MVNYLNNTLLLSSANYEVFHRLASKGISKIAE